MHLNALYGKKNTDTNFEMTSIVLFLHLHNPNVVFNKIVLVIGNDTMRGQLVPHRYVY